MLFLALDAHGHLGECVLFEQARQEGKFALGTRS